MADLGIADRNIFVDKDSGSTFQRKKYLALLEILRPGDTLFVESIDRLGRNYKDILDQWRYLVSHLQVDIVVLDMPILDTRSERDLTGKLISDIVLQLLSYVAEKERDHIRKRQREGIDIAKAKGTSFGRPKVLLDIQHFIEYQKNVEAGEVTHSEARKALNLKHSTYFNILREYRNKTGRFSE